MAINLEKVLTTGADGMVGGYVNFGIRTNHRSLDVTDLKEVLKVCDKYKPEVILHLAAETDVDLCERNPEYAYLINCLGTYNMAVAAKELGAKLVYISTSGVFDGVKQGPYTEEDEPNPKNYYARSKHLGEIIVKEILKNYLIARIDSVFGGGPAKDRKMVAAIVQQFNKPEIMAVKDQISSPTFGKDLISALKKLIENDTRGVFHLANKGFCTIYEFVKEIVDTLKPEIKVTPVESSYFNLDANRWKNKGMISKLDLMRPWREALKEYLETEWKSVLESKI